MFEKLFKRIESRRAFNRTKRFLAQRAQSRLIVGLVASGALKRYA